MRRVSHQHDDSQEPSADRIRQRIAAISRYTLSAIDVEMIRAIETGEELRVAAKRVGDIVRREEALTKRLLAVEMAAVVAPHLRPTLGVGTNGLPHLPRTRPPRGAAAASDRSPAARPSADQERRTIEAMIRHPKGDRVTWLARCGNATQGCRGELGHFRDADAERAFRGDDAYAHLPPDLRPVGRWLLFRAHGYGGDAERGFRLLEAPTRGSRVEKVGRSPLPDRFGNVGGRLDFLGRWRGFVGQVPQPLCLVECPICRTLNRVAMPPDE